MIAKGLAIGPGALFSFTDLSSGTIPLGTVITLVSNTAATAITGTSSNLGNGSMFTVGNNTYLVNYSGGDGNDLTLTVQ